LVLDNWFQEIVGKWLCLDSLRWLVSHSNSLMNRLPCSDRIGRQFNHVGNTVGLGIRVSRMCIGTFVIGFSLIVTFIIFVVEVEERF
jgi:hypothetical protein